MSLVDEARKIQGRGVSRGPRCSVARLSADLRKEVEEALELVDGFSLTAVSVSEALKEEHGVDIKPNTLNRHLRGGCRCD